MGMNLDKRLTLTLILKSESNITKKFINYLALADINIIIYYL